jgi:hypothetical protein
LLIVGIKHGAKSLTVLFGHVSEASSIFDDIVEQAR